MKKKQIETLRQKDHITLLAEAARKKAEIQVLVLKSKDEKNTNKLISLKREIALLLTLAKEQALAQQVKK